MGRIRLIPLFWVVVFICSLGLPAAGQDRAAEDEVRQVLTAFQRGVERGDKALAKELATSDFLPYFEPFHNSLADLYGKAKMAFPMTVGHVKILRDGRAKAEAYINPAKNLFVFTLRKEDGHWRFCHFEGIRFPLYEVPAAPASSVHQIPPATVKFMMAEMDTAFRNLVFFTLRDALGQERAMQFLAGSEGFRVAMDAWLPFIEGPAQFALFCGILEENYYGSKYVLAAASEDEAEIRFAPLQELEVMKIAVFYPKLSIEEYHKLYVAIMQDRARACGLSLQASFDGTSCTLRIRRIIAGQALDARPRPAYHRIEKRPGDKEDGDA